MLELSSAALGIAVVSCIGRGVLSWLPPGELGSHRTAELPATWAASYLLGCAFVAACASAAMLFGVPISCAWIATGGALLVLARWATLPAALVPRHEVAAERPDPLARALLGLALVLGIAACAAAGIDAQSGAWAGRAQAWLSGAGLLDLAPPSSRRGALDRGLLDAGAVAFASWPRGAVGEIAARAYLLACMLAALLLAERALAIARRAPVGRRMTLVLLALALAPAASADDGDLTIAALGALALAGTESWTRRADRRGLALACIGWASLPLVRSAGFALACAGLAATVATSARPSLRRAATWAIACALVALFWPLAAWSRHAALLGIEPLESLSSGWALNDRTRAAFCVAPVWVALGAALGPAILRVLRQPPAGNAQPEPREADWPRRDLAALLAFGAAALCVAGAVLASHDGSKLLLARTWAPGLLVQAAPFAAVLAARSLVRAERTA